MNKIRTFIAVNASRRINENLGQVIERLARTGADYKWVEPENLHLTLQFLGDLPDREIPQFCKEVKQSIQHHAPFEMSLAGLGAFPSAEQPRIIWAGVDQGSLELEYLYKDLQEVCRPWCTGRDRNEFSPHFTLGRLGRDGRWNQEFLFEIGRLHSHTAGSCQVDRVIVYSSFLDHSGPTYAPMATIKLSRTAAADSEG
jgi:2'-5' RNA ligase